MCEICKVFPVESVQSNQHSPLRDSYCINCLYDIYDIIKEILPNMRKHESRTIQSTDGDQTAS